MKKKGITYLTIGGVLILIVIFGVNRISSYNNAKLNVINLTENYLEKIKPEVTHNGKMFMKYKQIKNEREDDTYTEHVIVLYQEYFKEDNILKCDRKNYLYYKILITKHSIDNYAIRASKPIVLSENNSLDNVSKDVRDALMDKKIKNDLENKIKEKAIAFFNE